MQARNLPAVRGAFWLFEGFRLFRRNPPLITALTLAYLLVVQLLIFLLPGIGPILLPLLLPLMTLIVANGCRLVDLDRRADKAGLLHGISGNFPAMLRLGGWQLLGAVLVILLGMLLDWGETPLVVAPTGMETPVIREDGASPADAAGEAAMLGSLLQVLLLSSPLIILFWFAPFLVGWDKAGTLQALFFSAVASLRNWRAMFMFSIATILAAGVLPGIVLIGIAQISGMALPAALLVLRMILVFLVAPVLTASIYASYRDIFHPRVDTNV